MRLVLLFTTFPVATETFLQREVTVLRERGESLELVSLWGGAATFEGLPIRRVPWWHLGGLFFWLPWWALRRPGATGRILAGMFRGRWVNLTNVAENLLGFALGMVHARGWGRRTDTPTLHAVWASLPAAYAWTVAQLTGLPFSMAAHAYDLFEDGGDGWLGEKVAAAAWIRTSTEAGRARLRRAGADPGRVSLLRRGLVELPALAPRRAARWPLRLLSVGRFVPKMGHGRWLEILAALEAAGMEFEARIIGAGPGLAAFRTALSRQRWNARVEVLGAQPYAAVEAQLRWCDVLTFTGVVAPNGDQAGFPNIVGEAMAIGRPVVATPVGGVAEVLRGDRNGVVATSTEAWVRALDRCARDDAFYDRLCAGGRAWVEANFLAGPHMEQLCTELRARQRIRAEVSAEEASRAPRPPPP